VVRIEPALFPSSGGWETSAGHPTKAAKKLALTPTTTWRSCWRRWLKPIAQGFAAKEPRSPLKFSRCGFDGESTGFVAVLRGVGSNLSLDPYGPLIQQDDPSLWRGHSGHGGECHLPGPLLPGLRPCLAAGRDELDLLDPVAVQAWLPQSPRCWWVAGGGGRWRDSWPTRHLPADFLPSRI